MTGPWTINKDRTPIRGRLAIGIMTAVIMWQFLAFGPPSGELLADGLVKGGNEATGEEADDGGFFDEEEAESDEEEAAGDGLSNKVLNKALAGARRAARGRMLYGRACKTCHGVTGNGYGPAAKYLDPLPRNLARGVFKFRTTQSGALPTDEDLERTIRVGVPGTDMPAFGEVFSKADRMALVAYIKTFSNKFGDPVFALEPEDLVKIPEKRAKPTSDKTIALGRKVYEKMDCAKCHGPTGRGDGPAAKAGLKDDWGRPIKAYNFTRGIYKSGRREADLYRTFTTGLNGTPMPSFGDLLSDEERWALADYIRSLAPRRGFWGRMLKEDLK